MRPFASQSAGRAAAQRGSVMIEALVSIVVTSLALLASAALAVNAAKVNQSSRYRAQAVMLANDIAERLTANVAAAADGAYALAANDPMPPQTGEGAPPNCNAEACTVEQLAAADLAAWRAKVQSELPQATATLAFTSASGTVPARYTVNLQWVERAVGHGGSARTNGGTVTDAETFAYTATVALRPPRD